MSDGPEHLLLRVGAEAVPLLAVRVSEPERHLLLRAVELRRLLQRRHHRPLALVRVHSLLQVGKDFRLFIVVRN